MMRRNRRARAVGLACAAVAGSVAVDTTAQIEQAPPDTAGVLEIAGDDAEVAESGPGPEVAEGQTEAEPRDPDEEEALGLRLSGGRAFTRGVADGWYGRLDFAVYTGYKPGRGGGAVTIGVEGWGAEDAGGGSLPLTSGVVVEQGVFFLSLGFGFDVFLVDKVDGDIGLGPMAPMVGLEVGANFDGFRILADCRGRYRWQFQADDRKQALLGLSLEIPL